MADAPTELQQDALPDFVLIRTDQVDEGDRMRKIDPVWAEALGRVIVREGQRTPIEVCRLPGSDRWTLVAGGHRLAGARSAGIEYLRAEIVGANRDERRLREVSENLWRRDLEPYDRAAFVAEAVAIHKRRAGLDPAADGRVASVNARWQKQLQEEADDTTATMSVVYGWSDEIGEQLRLSARTIRRDLLLYRRIAPSLIERLRTDRHPVATNASQLRALAKLDSDEQAAVVDRLLGGNAPLGEVYGGTPAPKTVSDAVARLRGSNRAIDPDAKRLSAFIGAFQRMGIAEKKGALAQLAGMLPAGIRLQEGEPAKPSFPVEHQRYREEAITAIDCMRGLVDDLLEDEVLGGERASNLERANRDLQLTRFTIAGNGFELGRAAQ